MSDLTEQARQDLQAKLREIDAAIAGIDAAKARADRAVALLQQVRRIFLEEHGVVGEPVGSCDTCGRLLLPGDKGHSDSSGDLLWCEDHAPTWSEVLAQYRECEGIEPVDQEPEDAAAGRAAAQARVDAGDCDVKHVWEL